VVVVVTGGSVVVTVVVLVLVSVVVVGLGGNVTDVLYGATQYRYLSSNAQSGELPLSDGFLVLC
jgi:hypothetical protein